MSRTYLQSIIHGSRIGWVARSFGVLGVFVLIAASASALEIKRHEITWTISGSPVNGTYANGDPWVVGPITLTGPTSSGDRNGTMLGPNTVGTSAPHGFDGRMGQYNAALNIGAQLPYVVPVNRTVISTISYVPDRTRNQVDHCSVLTVVVSPPAAGAFRPPYFGHDKTSYWNKSQIDYSKLQTLAPVANTPTLASVERMFERPMVNLANQYESNYTMAYYNTPIFGKNYGRELSYGASFAGLMLNLNFSNAQKEPLAINLIQTGIDYYGGRLLGQRHIANGGHQGGKKLPTLMAGVLLNDQKIIDSAAGSIPPPRNWAEDMQHFYVSQNDINTPRSTNDADGTRPISPYSQDMLGFPEWASNYDDKPTEAGSNWNRIYRLVVGPNLTGCALTVKLMGLEEVWGNQAFIDYYVERFVPIERTKGSINVFMLNMWDAYAGKAPPASAAQVSVPVMNPKGGTFMEGTSVELSSTTTGALIHYTLNGADPTAASPVYSGPIKVASTTTIKAIGLKDGLEPSLIAKQIYLFGLPMPSASPPAGSYLGVQSVTLSSEVSGAVIHYTLDGTAPTTNSPKYDTPITLSESATLRAIAVKPGLDNSLGLEAAYFINEFDVLDKWQNLAIGPYVGGALEVTFIASPSKVPMDGVVGLSLGRAQDYTGLAAVVRFAPTGFIDARNGGAYQGTNALAYKAGVPYRFRMVINLDNRSYSVYVAPEGAGEVAVAKDFAFRTEQAGVGSLEYLSTFAGDGSMSVKSWADHAGGDLRPSAPSGLRVLPD